VTAGRDACTTRCGLPRPFGHSVKGTSVTLSGIPLALAALRTAASLGPSQMQYILVLSALALALDVAQCTPNSEPPTAACSPEHKQ
jgi:hypothetical protein